MGVTSVEGPHSSLDRTIIIESASSLAEARFALFLKESGLFLQQNFV